MQTTPSQTVGPFFAYGLTAKQYGYDYNSVFSNSIAVDVTIGERVKIVGQLFDGQGNIINDAMVELVQNIEINGQKIAKIAREGTGPDADNKFYFIANKIIVEDQAPYINVIVLMRGSLRHLYTRLYFSDEAERNCHDNLLNSVQGERRKTLVANKIERNGEIFYEFNISMQGENETVFFDL